MVLDPLSLSCLSRVSEVFLGWVFCGTKMWRLEVLTLCCLKLLKDNECRRSNTGFVKHHETYRRCSLIIRKEFLRRFQRKNPLYNFCEKRWDQLISHEKVKIGKGERERGPKYPLTSLENKWRGNRHSPGGTEEYGDSDTGWTGTQIPTVRYLLLSYPSWL